MNSLTKALRARSTQILRTPARSFEQTVVAKTLAVVADVIDEENIRLAKEKIAEEMRATPPVESEPETPNDQTKDGLGTSL